MEALCENESEIGHFPTVFECKDSAELRHSKLFRAKNVTFPTFKKKRLSLVAKEALFGQKEGMAQSMKNMFFYISVDVKMNLSQIVLCSTTQKYAKYLISTRKLLWRCNVFWTFLTLVTHNAIKISTLQRCPMSNVQCNVFCYCNMAYNIIIIK